MANEIIIRTDRKFKASALNDAVKGLSKAFQNIGSSRKDACLIMWRLEDGKKYQEDGFKSLFEFAETIGIDKSTAHKMADAGRVYDSKEPAIAKLADKAGYTVAANLASMLKDENQAAKLKEAAETGTFDKFETVDDFKTWKADATAQSKPEKVVPTYHIRGHAFKMTSAVDPETGNPKATVITLLDETVGIEKPEDWAREFDDTALVSKVKNAEGTILYLCITADGSMFEYSATRVKETKKSVTKSAQKMTKEELIAMAEAMGMKVTF